MKYIQLDSFGNLYTRYDSEIHTSIPSAAIPVSDELFWQTINETDGVWKWAGIEIKKVPFPPPTVEQIAATTLTLNTATFNEKMKVANDAVTALQDKVDTDLASEGEKTTLVAWKAHRVALRAIDLTAQGITWPVAP